MPVLQRGAGGGGRRPCRARRDQPARRASCSVHGPMNGLAKANSRPTATEMMNAASIRPAVMNMRTCSTGISSGWRAADSRNLPDMMARPRPAPSAARPTMMPIPRAVKAWTWASVVRMVSMVISGRDALRVGRKGWGGAGVGAEKLELELEPGTGAGTSVAVFRQAQVDDRQHHEDEGLQRDHQDVEDHPAQAEHRAAEHADDAGAAKHPDQQEHDLAAEHVAEQSHRQRNRLRDPFDDVEDEVERHHPLAEGRGQEF